MHVPKLDPPAGRQNSASLILRLMLRRDEVFRLPAASQAVQVVSGLAWLTMAGEDILLKSGQKLWLVANKDLVLISALGQSPLVLEVMGDRALQGMLIAPPQSRPGTI